MRASTIKTCAQQALLAKQGTRDGILGASYPQNTVPPFNESTLIDVVLRQHGLPDVFSMQCCGWDGASIDGSGHTGAWRRARSYSTRKCWRHCACTAAKRTADREGNERLERKVELGRWGGRLQAVFSGKNMKALSEDHILERKVGSSPRGAAARPPIRGLAGKPD